MSGCSETSGTRNCRGPLARYFGMSELFWSMQAHYDLEVQKDRLGDSPEKEVPVYASVK